MVSDAAFEACMAKMRDNDVSDVAIAQFTRLYEAWQADETGWIREEDVEAVKQVPHVQDIRKSSDPQRNHDALAKTVMLKLNGGLGTSMGLDKAKSLLNVRRHKARKMTFLDIILGQVITVRQRQNVNLPLVLMNSFRTSRDSLAVVKKNRKFHQTEVPLEIIQHREPKIVAHTGRPVSFAENRELEWCPSGHGDVFSTLWESGLLDTLQNQGYEYLFISNSDNLGARPSSVISGAFADSGAPFMVEVSRRTSADRKGGHIVRDKKTGALILREMSQVHPDDKSKATNVKRHPYFNTNNIWVRISALRKILREYGGILPLPVIRNAKTVDPTNPASTQVIQLEIAMGAAIGLFPDAICIEVDRQRFLPVKTTNDLFILRSDRFHLTDAYEIEDGNYIFPDIDLDPQYYKNISDFDERFPYGVPSLAAANSVTIRGDWTFGHDVRCFADAVLEDQGMPSYVPNGEFFGPHGVEPDEWL